MMHSKFGSMSRVLFDNGSLESVHRSRAISGDRSTLHLGSRLWRRLLWPRPRRKRSACLKVGGSGEVRAFSPARDSEGYSESLGSACNTRLRGASRVRRGYS